MKSRTLLILALVAAFAVIVGVVIRQSGRREWGADATAIGKPILDDLPINDVATITLTGPEHSVSLTRGDGEWRVLERYGYPANWDTISQLVKQLANERVKQTITVGRTDYHRLNLLPPDGDPAENAGTRLELLDAKGTSLAHVRFGKQHMADAGAMPNPMMRGQSFPDGRYLLLEKGGDEDSVVLVSNTFGAVTTDPTRWLDKQFLELRNVTSASLERDGKLIWELETDPEADKLTLADDIPDNRTIKSSAVSGTGRALAYASFTDVADPELSDQETGMDNPALFRAVNEDNVACTLRIGNETGGNYYVQADVAFRQPPEDAADEDEAVEGEDEENKDDGEDIRIKARELNERLDGWTYLLPKHTVDKLLRTREDFLEKVKEEENEDAAEAAHAATPPATPAERDTDIPPPPPPPPPPAE